MDVDKFAAVDHAARDKFTYKPDGTTNTWRSHADAVKAGAPWEGDCDDLVSTVLDLLGRSGFPLSLRYRLLVSSKRDSTVDHMVAAAKADNGEFYIIGDTFRPCYPASEMAHRGLFYNRLDEAMPTPTWRQGVPWDV